MNIIVGHTNMDLDCLGSIALARCLYPDYTPIKSHLMHPAARNLLNLYEDSLSLPGAAELRGQSIERVVVVDTRSMGRVEEYFRNVDLSAVEFEVYDHHPANGDEIPGASIHETSYGANTTQLGLEVMRRGIAVTPEVATIALTGIYADTGNFTHDNVAREDFDVAAFLLERGASLKLVKEFLVPLKDRHQVVLFHEVLNSLEERSIRGHSVKTCYMELDEDTLGLGAVVEQVFEVERGDVLLGFFMFRRKGKMLVIARSLSADARLNEILADFGGGGHAQAASATVKTADGRELFTRVLALLELALGPAATARDIMSCPVESLGPEMSLLEASMFFERVSHTGAPVVDTEGRVVGFLTLRDIMTGRKAGQMHVPVRTFMSKKIVAASPDTTVRSIESLLFENDVGHLPVVEDGTLMGIVTRFDYLDYRRGDRARRQALLTAAEPEIAAYSCVDALPNDEAAVSKLP